MITNRFGSAAIDAALAAEVRAEIARRPDLSIARIADTLGVRRATLSERINGHVAFSYSQLMLVAEVLGLTVRELDARAKQSLGGEIQPTVERDDAFLALAAGTPPSPSTSTSGVAS